MSSVFTCLATYRLKIQHLEREWYYKCSSNSEVREAGIQVSQSEVGGLSKALDTIILD